MAAEVQRIQPGIYLLFLGGNLTTDELTDHLQRYEQAVVSDRTPDPVLVLDCVDLYNPLKAARLIAQQHPTAAHYVVVNSNRAGAVLAERLAQRIPGTSVEAALTQPQATDRAKSIRGTHHLDDHHCDYL